MSYADGLTIDWTLMPTYNTIMSVAVGAGLLTLAGFIREAARDPENLNVGGYAVNFGVLGFILTLTGAHMTLTWPLATYFPFDNIVFGETSLAFGVLLSAAAIYLWRRGDSLKEAASPVEAARPARPASVFVFGMGLSLIAVAVAGVRYKLFAAPPEEPISGEFADYPMVEAIFMSGLIALVGLGAVLLPAALRRPEGFATKAATALWSVSGAAFLLFGAMNFFTHIGLIVNTM